MAARCRAPARKDTPQDLTSKCLVPCCRIPRQLHGCIATIRSAVRIDSRFWIPSGNRCLIKMLPSQGANSWTHLRSAKWYNVREIERKSSTEIQRRLTLPTFTPRLSVAANTGDAIQRQYTGHLKLGRLQPACGVHWSPQSGIPCLAALDRAFQTVRFLIPHGNIP